MYLLVFNNLWKRINIIFYPKFFIGNVKNVQRTIRAFKDNQERQNLHFFKIFKWFGPFRFSSVSVFSVILFLLTWNVEATCVIWAPRFPLLCTFLFPPLPLIYYPIPYSPPSHIFPISHPSNFDK